MSSGKVNAKGPKNLRSDSCQSPDDLDATYRGKNGKKSKGQSINIVETAHPENSIHLITDVAVNPNNKDDSQVLNERIDRLKEKTPELVELHFDGAYGSSDNDKKFEKHHVTPVQTAVKGPEPAVKIEIEQTSETKYTVSCPRQELTSEKTRKRNKVQFDLKLCKRCSNCTVCPKGKKGVYYFTHDDYLRKKHQKQIEAISSERRKIRNNVEATVNEFVRKMPKGKLKVRGAFKAGVFAYSMAISINFGRIYRLIQESL